MSEQWQPWLGNSRPEDHHTTGGDRAWNLEVGEWCYRHDWCDQCKRAEYGDPWDALQAVRDLCDERERAGARYLGPDTLTVAEVRDAMGGAG